MPKVFVTKPAFYNLKSFRPGAWRHYVEPRWAFGKTVIARPVISVDSPFVEQMMMLDYHQARAVRCLSWYNKWSVTSSGYIGVKTKKNTYQFRYFGPSYGRKRFARWSNVHAAIIFGTD